MKVTVKKGDFFIETELKAHTYVDTFEMLLKFLDKIKEVVS